MKSLDACINKAGKALSKRDADAMKSRLAQFNNDPVAAVADYQSQLEDDSFALTNEILKAAGKEPIEQATFIEDADKQVEMAKASLKVDNKTNDQREEDQTAAAEQYEKDVKYVQADDQRVAAEEDQLKVDKSIKRNQRKVEQERKRLTGETPKNTAMAEAMEKAQSEAESKSPKSERAKEPEGAIVAVAAGGKTLTTIELNKKIEEEANKAATSDKNDLNKPTEAQKSAGNYQKGHVNVNGLDIAIENAEGSTREGTSPDGKTWSQKMANNYGYIKRSEGADGDQVDVFLGKEEADTVFVVDQVDADGFFDEHKVMMNFGSKRKAVNAYKRNYPAGHKVGEVTEMSVADFKQWVKTSQVTKPLSESTQLRPQEQSEMDLKQPVEVEAGTQLDMGIETERQRLQREAQEYEARMAEENRRHKAWVKGEKAGVKRVPADPKNPTRQARAVTLKTLQARLKKAADDAEYMINDFEGGYITRDQLNAQRKLVRDIQAEIDALPDTRQSRSRLQPGLKGKTLTVSEVADAISPMLEGMQKLKGKLHIHESLETAPDNVKAALKDKGTSDAAFVDGEVHIFANRTGSAKDAVAKLLHEGVTHFGLRATMEGSAMEDLMIDIHESVMNKPEFKALAELYEADLSKVSNQLEMTEEYIAFLSESGTDANIVQRVIDAVRKWLRSKGVTNIWTDNDIKALLRDVRTNLNQETTSDGNPIEQTRTKYFGKRNNQKSEKGSSGPYSKRSTGNAEGVVGRYSFAARSDADALNEHGVSTPDFLEVSSTDDFFGAINSAKKSNKFGSSVYIYDKADYDGMRLFVTENRLSGFAIKGDDVVSVFNHRDSTNNQVSVPIMLLAIQEGGRRADAFDTVLPHLYSQVGFKVVARTNWEDQYAPPDWNKDTYAKFNNGEPDVTYMVYDPDWTGGYSTSQGQLVSDMDAAVALQDSTIESLNESGVYQSKSKDAMKFLKSDKANAELLAETPTMKRTARLTNNSLTVDERERVTSQGLRSIDAFFAAVSNKIVDEMADMALAGSAKRGWYSLSNNAMSTIFEGDLARFSHLLAALSPQSSVESNLRNTLNVWSAWKKANYPTDPEAIMRIAEANVESFTTTLQRQIDEADTPAKKANRIAHLEKHIAKGGSNVLGAWQNNMIRALTTADPSQLQLSGPKVDSFTKNLQRLFEEVTNDTWMGRAIGVAQTKFSGSHRKGLDQGNADGKGPGYLAANIIVRRAARKLTKTTGVKWTPAEVQETVWSFVKTVWEARMSEGENMTMLQLVENGVITDEKIASTPDFGTLFLEAEYANILKDAGYGRQLEELQAQQDAIAAENGGAEATGATPVRQGRNLGRAVRRLDKQYTKEKLTDTEQANATRLALSRENIEALQNNPKSNESRGVKLNSVIDEGIKTPPDAGRIRTALTSMNRARKEAVLYVMPRKALKDFADKTRMSAAHEIDQTADRMDGQQAKYENAVADTVNKWWKFHGKEPEGGKALADVMHASTLTGQDPTVAFKPRIDVAATRAQIDELLAARHEGTTETMEKRLKRLQSQVTEETKRKQQHILISKAYNQLVKNHPIAAEIYAEAREHNDQSYNTTMDLLIKRIEAADIDPESKKKTKEMMRLKFESGKVEGPYFTLGRHGTFWGVAKQGDETISFAKFETPQQKDAWVAEWNKEEGVDAYGGEDVQGNAQESMKHVDEQFMVDLQKYLGKEGVNAEIKDDIWQMYMKTLPEMSARKNFMRRKGLHGFSHDALRSFTGHQFKASHMMAKLEYGHQLESQLAKLKEQATLESDKDLWAMPLYEEILKRHEYAMNPSEADWAVRMTSFGFHWYLGFNPSTAAVNLTQTWILGVPVLGAAEGGLNGIGKASKELSIASAQLLPGRDQQVNLTAEEQTAFEEFKAINLFERTQGADLSGMSQRGESFASSGINVPGLSMPVNGRTFTEASAFLFHHAEVFNREVTALAAYRLARKRNLSHEEAILHAEKMTWDTHFDYSNKNRPRIMQKGLGRVAFLFKNYSANIGYRMGRDIVDIYKGKERAQALTRLTGVLGTTALMAGAKGLPIWWAIYGIAMVLEDDDEPIHVEGSIRSWLTEAVDEDFSHLIMDGGIDTLTELSVSQRVSLSSLFIRNTEKAMDAPEYYAHYLQEALGPIFGGFVSSAAMAHYDYSRGDDDLAMERLTPTIVKKWLQVSRLEAEGLKNRSGEAIMDKEEFGAWEAFAGMSGFGSPKVNLAYKRNEVAYTLFDKLERRKAQLTTRWVKAKERGQLGRMKMIQDQRAIFNAKNPKNKLTQSRLNKAFKARRTGQRNSVGGVDKKAAKLAAQSGMQKF